MSAPPKPLTTEDWAEHDRLLKAARVESFELNPLYQAWPAQCTLAKWMWDNHSRLVTAARAAQPPQGQAEDGRQEALAEANKRNPDAPQLDRVMIGKGEYVRADEAVRTIGRLLAEVEELKPARDAAYALGRQDAERQEERRVTMLNEIGITCALEAAAQLDNSFQGRVAPWMQACFGPEISADRIERGDRLLEEVLELLQSGGYDQTRVPTLCDYVWGRPVGQPTQEVGGVMVTLAAYCLAHGLDMHGAGDIELARIWTKVEQIRAKQASKRGLHTPLPVPQELAETASSDPEESWYRSQGGDDEAPWIRCTSREDAIAAGLPGETFQIALGSPHRAWDKLFDGAADLADHIDATNEDNAFEEGFCEEAALSTKDLEPLTAQINALWAAFVAQHKPTGNLLRLRAYETITKPVSAAS